jgi:hypothetical protein
MKIYVATKFEKYVYAKEVISHLKAAGHTITHDWTDKAHEVFSTQQDPDSEVEHDWPAIGRAELEGVMAADVCVVLFPCVEGAHVELGIALGAGRRAVLVGKPSRPLPFYYVPGVRRVADVDALLKTLG